MAIIGFLLVALGALLGLYVGGWVMFIGGIMAIANAIDTQTLTAMLIAINVIKILLAGFIGWAIFWIGAIIGKIMIDLD